MFRLLKLFYFVFCILYFKRLSIWDHQYYEVISGNTKRNRDFKERIAAT
jgi:hypothetical protein